jgi:hypothetical protein
VVRRIERYYDDGRDAYYLRKTLEDSAQISAIRSTRRRRRPIELAPRAT